MTAPKDPPPGTETRKVRTSVTGERIALPEALHTMGTPAGYALAVVVVTVALAASMLLGQFISR